MGSVDDSLASSQCNKASFDVPYQLIYSPATPSINLYFCNQQSVTEHRPCAINPVAPLIAILCCMCLQLALSYDTQRLGKVLVLKNNCSISSSILSYSSIFGLIGLLPIKISHPTPISERFRYFQVFCRDLAP